MNTRRLPSPRRERGAILVLALMFLVLLTIIGVSSISGVTLEEKMAGNLRDQNLAFQAAESALRDAEADLEKDIGATGGNPLCTAPCPRDEMKINPNFVVKCNASFGTTAATKGLCRADATTGGFQTEIVTASGWDWLDTNKTVEYGRYTGAKALPNVVQQPRYVIEWLQEKDEVTTPPTRYFRISARGWGGNLATTVTLQAVYRMAMEDGP